MHVTEAELREIEARLSEISPGPWKSYIEGRDFTSGSSCITVGEVGDRRDDIELIGATVADQDFIASSRQYIPRLIAEVRRLQETLKSHIKS